MISIYDKILRFDLIKGGGKGYFFEQIVVSNLSPSIKNVIIPNLFIKQRKIIPFLNLLKSIFHIQSK